MFHTISSGRKWEKSSARVVSAQTTTRRSLNHEAGFRKKVNPLLAENVSTRKTHSASK
ncbi:Uncharacterised protein [Mycobacteroides abscessus subsp. abscessus]|nr:Uncharacterised protein [Mycobacteroides abscessus subsp. abscessus]